MIKLTFKKPTELYTDFKDLKIYDTNGIEFYCTKDLPNFTGFFSVPRGTYLFTRPVKLNKMKVKKYIPSKLPFERDLKHNWKLFKIRFKRNPHKCTIDHKNKTITFDPVFKKAPKYQLIFILLHEKGHNFYKTEWKADYFAVRAMIKRGFNPSQIGKAPLLTLSEKNIERQKRVVQFLTNNYSNYGNT